MKITAAEIKFDKLVRSAHLDAVNQLNNKPRHMLDEGNPNHPMYDQIFGYDRETFMAKQYKN